MKTTILVKTGNERGWRVPTVTAYRNEDELRMLLKDSPELLPGDDASRPVVLAHEFPVTFGSVDLVGVSPTGRPDRGRVQVAGQLRDSAHYRRPTLRLCGGDVGDDLRGVRRGVADPHQAASPRGR